MKRYILLFALVPTFLFAQNNGDSLRFEIIKQSVGFLSTDKETFKESKGKPPSDCIYPDYECLRKYCLENKLTKAEDKVNDWKKQPAGSKIDLEKLSEKIRLDLTSGEKKRRTTLPGYERYKIALNQLVLSFSAISPKDSSTVKPPVETNATEKELPSEVKSESNLALIALILGGLALALGVVNLLMNRVNTSDKEKLKLNYDILNEDFKDFKNRSNQKQGVDLKPLEDKIRNLESRIQSIENQPRIVELPIERKINNQINSTNSNRQTLYAKLPDAGNGFSQSILTKDQNGEQIYEIEIRGDKGSFSVSSDVNAQKYALSDFNYYLSNACEFLNQPVKNCRINTQERGILIKSGSNWIIQSKAKIEFK